MMAPEQHPANYASTTDARKRLAEQNGTHTPHWDPAVVQLIEQARAEGAAEVVARMTAEVEALPTTRTQGWLKGWDSVSLEDVLAALRGDAR